MSRWSSSVAARESSWGSKLTGSDIIPAVSMCFEKPEEGLLTRKPRDVKKDKLVDWKLCLHAYGFLGIIESLCSLAMGFWYLQRRGYPFKDIVFAYGGLPDHLDSAGWQEAVNRGTSVTFFTLVFMQWFNLLATRTRRRSIFQQNPFYGPKRNLWVIAGMAGSLGMLFFFSYPPFFQKAFLTRGVPVEYVFLPFAFGSFILLADEARKWANRRYPAGILANIAW